MTKTVLGVAVLTIALSSCPTGLGSRVYPDGTVFDGGVATNPKIGLVAGFTMDGNIDGDSPVSLVGTTWIEGVEGQALEFSGSGDYATLANHPGLDLATEGSVLAWVRVNVHTGYPTIVTKGPAADNDWGLHFWQNQGQVALWLKNGTPQSHLVYSVAWLPEGLWVHVAATWDLSIMRIYINGALDDWAPNKIGPARAVSNVLFIGGFEGAIDEVQIYDRALNAGEIDRVYRLGWP